MRNGIIGFIVGVIIATSYTAYAVNLSRDTELLREDVTKVKSELEAMRESIAALEDGASEMKEVQKELVRISQCTPSVNGFPGTCPSKETPHP